MKHKFEQALVRAWNHRGALAWLLWPLSLLFGALVGLRRTLYRMGVFKTRRLAVPVIVVGNVVAGGSGKTPVVMAIVKHLQASGLPVGVVSRGYGRAGVDCLEVHIDSPAGDVGDEPALIKRSIPETPVFVAASRFEAASALLARYPQTRVVVCDDGLQHLALCRDINICVFDDRGMGNGFLLPAGPLREPWPRGVDLVLHSGAKPAFANGYRATRALGAYALRSDGGQVPLQTLTAPLKPMLAVAGIAQPQTFFDMLRQAGLTLAETRALPDHYDFSSWSRIIDGGYTLICTEKDAVKLWPVQPDALAVPLVFTPEPAFLQALDALLTPLLAPPPQ